MYRIVFLSFLWLAMVTLSFYSKAQSPAFEQGRVITDMPAVLPFKERIEPINAMLQERLDTLLPELMAESDIDMWLVINREYGEDKLFYTLVPQPTFAARRTTILVFAKTDDGVERFSVSRYAIGDTYPTVWEGGSLEQQWARLAEVIAQRDPDRIGINISRDWPMADGLSAGLEQLLREALPPKYEERLVSAEKLVLRWLETRSPLEQQIYPHVVNIARAVIAEGFSNKVITPGKTTTDDVAWYLRNRFEELQLRPWFQPYVNIQRRGDATTQDDVFMGKEGIVIMRGDILHTDVGICYLNQCTDTQEMAYVLQLGETDAPQGLKDAMAIGNTWQDILTGEFVTGRTGNEILAATQEKATAQGIFSSTYTHPIGFVGHASGPTIGMWDNQGPTPIRGDYPLYPDTAYAIEGNIKTQVPEWDDQWVQIKLEQSALFDGEKVWYLAGRQTHWHLVR